MKYFLIAGEASGDLHGANLVRSLKEQDPEAEFLCFGGGLMQSAGAELARHYRDMAFMGAIDVVRNLGKISANFRLCREKLIEFKPDVLILIDYPGFNLKMAEFAKKHNIRVFYYILPKVWAWKSWRVKKLRRYTDAMFSIFPFEDAFFRKHKARVHYVGNPLLDAVSESLRAPSEREDFLAKHNLSDKPIVALLPGSRAQEIRLMLPVMTRLAKDFPDFNFVISGAPGLDPELYEQCTEDSSIPVIFGVTYFLLRHSFAAVVTSGTATLETALFNVPQVVLYKMAGGKLGFRIFRWLFLKVKYVSLPNLVLGSEMVKEFIMDRMKYEYVHPEVVKLLHDERYRAALFTRYKELHGIMGEEGASWHAASMMLQLLHPNKAEYA